MEQVNAQGAPRRPLVRGFFYNNADLYPPIVNAIRLLSRAGFEVELNCRGDATGVSYPVGVKINRIDPSGVGSAGQFFAFCRQAGCLRSGRKADLYWGHDMHGFFAARVAAWRARRPLIYHCHDFADSGTASAGIWFVRAFERTFARSAEVVVIPEAGRAPLVTKVLSLSNPPFVAANAPLLAPLVSGGALRETLRRRGVHFDKIVFRQGRIGRGHAIEATIASLPAWQNPNWGCVFMGIFEQSYVHELHERARAIGVAGRFVVLPPVNYDEVLSYTRDADLGNALYEAIGVNFTYSGTASNKMMEYLAAGVPLLVSRNETQREIVSRFSCGVSADERDPASIASAINLALGNDSETAARRVAARQAFEQQFCYDRQFSATLQRMRTLALRETSIVE